MSDGGSNLDGRPGGDVVAVDRNLLYWLLAFFALLAALWLLADVLLPFVAAFFIAFVLNPVVKWLSRRGINRGFAALLLLAIFGVILAGAAVLLGPLLVSEVQSLAAAMPPGLDRLTALLVKLGVLPPASAAGSGGIGDLITEIAKGSSSFVSSLTTTVLSGGFAILNGFGLVLVTPIITYYLLADWPDVVGRLKQLLPPRSRPFVEETAEGINQVLSRFVRGQALVCLILAAYYAIALSLTGLSNAVLLGLAAGVLAFIPFLGIAGSFAAGIIMALSQFGVDWWHLGAVAAVFAVGQLLEGYVLTPGLVGSRIGLHPGWLIFAFVAFGYLFGLVGLLVAVPVSAAIGVIVRAIFAHYAGSDFYQAGARQPGDGDA